VVKDSIPFLSVVAVQLEGTEISSSSRINLQDQMYHYLTNPESAASHGAYTH
jgi:hypothetical protein